MHSVTVRLGRRVDRFLSRLQRRLNRYLHDLAGVERSNAFTLGSAYEAGWEGYECIFVLSTGRTGTQTLSTLLGCSPFVDAEHEPAPRLVKLSFDAFSDRSQERWIEKWAPLVLAARDDHVLRAKRGGRIYVETNNRLTALAPALRAAFPSSRYIFLHRDPFKVIVSGMRRGAYQEANMAWNFARIHPATDDPYFEQWDEMSPVEKEAWRWSRINSDILEFMDTLPDDSRYELTATELFSNDEATYDKLFRYVGVPTPPVRDLESVLGQRLNAGAHYDEIDFSLSSMDEEMIRPLIKDVAERLGYST